MATSSPAPLEIGILIFPGMTLLDMAGPHGTLAPHGRAHLLWKTLDPVIGDSGIAMTPTTTLADAPEKLDVLLIPGGGGVNDVIKDREVIDFIRKVGQNSRYVTGVCMGTIVLAAAGLLDGYRATTHWAYFDAMEAWGVETVRERVVKDRNRITGGGVTAGIDFGLTMVGELLGEKMAKFTQLALEYNPAPLYDAGSPEAAGPELAAMVRTYTDPGVAELVETAKVLQRERATA